MNTNTRKKRTVINPLIDIQDISITSGVNFINYIQASRTKLKEREMELVHKRFEICKNIIIQSIRQFTIENTEAFNKHKGKVYIQVGRMERENYEAYYKLKDKLGHNHIQDTFNQAITHKLSNWKGYEGKKLKDKMGQINTFPAYFAASKKWWDVHKMSIIAKDFLIPISHTINEFVLTAAREFFAGLFFNFQKLYAEYLNSLILLNLMKGMMKLPNTKSLYVIPTQTYLFITLKDFKFVLSSKKLDSSKSIRNDILEALAEQYRATKLQFQSELLSLHFEVDNYKCKNMRENINNYSSTEHTQCSNNSDPSSPNKMIIYMNYGNHHSVDNHKTKAIRYHPFQRPT